MIATKTFTYNFTTYEIVPAHLCYSPIKEQKQSRRGYTLTYNFRATVYSTSRIASAFQLSREREGRHIQAQIPSC